MIRSRALPFAAVATVLCGALAVPPAHAAADAASGGATPQALVERMLAAAETKDMAEMARCLDPGSRMQFSMGLLMATTMMVAFLGMGADMAAGADGTAEDKAKAQKSHAEAALEMASTRAAYSALLQKHGLPDLLDEKSLPRDDAAAASALSKVDQGALAADLFRFMEQIGDKKQIGESEGPLPAPRNVTDYAIKGDTATAKSGEDTMEFVKVDGRWYFKLPERSGPEEAPGATN